MGSEGEPLELNEAICRDPSWLKGLLKGWRRIEDNIANTINREQTRHTAHDCENLWKRREEVVKKRHGLIDFCASVLSSTVNDSNGVLLQQVLNERAVEQILQKRAIEIFRQKCRGHIQGL